MYFLPTVLKSIKDQGEKMSNSNKTLLDVVSLGDIKLPYKWSELHVILQEINKKCQKFFWT